METAEKKISVEQAANSVTVSVNPEVYPLDVIYGAAFVYIDRAYVLLDRGDDQHVTVTLTARSPSDYATLTALGGAFANELLTQALRATIAKKTQKIRELVINRALYSAIDAGGAPGATVLDDDDDDLSFLDDPLGIAVPWEEKYEGGAADSQPAGDAAPAADGDDDLAFLDAPLGEGDDPLGLDKSWDGETAPADDAASQPETKDKP